MSARRRNSVAQVPPELALGFCRSGAHHPGEATLRWYDRTIALRPDSRLVPHGHITVSLLRPPPPTPPPHPPPPRGGARTHVAASPPTPPHKGEGSRPSLPLAPVPFQRPASSVPAASRARWRALPDQAIAVVEEEGLDLGLDLAQRGDDVLRLFASHEDGLGLDDVGIVADELGVLPQFDERRSHQR